LDRFGKETQQLRTRIPATQNASSQKSLLRYLLSGVIVAGVVMMQPTTTHARPLLDELQVLLSTSPALRASLEEANARGHEVNVSAADREPLVQATGESGFERTDQPANEQLRNAVGLSVTQTLYDGYGTQNRILASNLNERVGHMDLETARNTLLMEGVQAYINVVLQNRLVGISKRNVEIIEEITNFISRERALGRMTLADHLQSRARLQQSRETLISFEGAREQAVARYKTLFGHVPEISVMQDPLAPTTYVPPTLPEALQYATSHNPLIEGARVAVEMANAQRMALGSSIMPQIDLIGSVDVQNDYDGASGTTEEGSLVVSMSWDLYDGNRTTASQMAATSRESAALATLNQRELDVIEQTTMAWNGMFMDRKRADTLREAESIALEAYDARYSLMITGEDTIINVLDTALEVLNVRTAKTTADYRYRLSVYRLLSTMGRLAPDTIPSIITTRALDLSDSEAISPNKLSPSDLIAAPATSPSSPDAASISATLSKIVADMAAADAAPTPMAAAPVQPTTTMSPDTITDGYYVILSANRQERNAVNAMSQIKVQGTSVLAVQSGGSTLYMVVVGPLAEPEARLVQGEAFGVGILDAWLKKSSSL
jgi:outer membrane protein, adhesin transport system